MTLNRLNVDWSGPEVVGPGLSTFFYSGSMTGVPAAVVTFYNAIKALIPSGLTITIPSAGDTLDEATGALTGAWSGSGGGTVATTGSGSFSQGVGARVMWNTAGVHSGRRVRGATFIVPIVGSAYDSGGLVGTVATGTLQTAADALVASTTSVWKIWSRPDPTTGYATNSVVSALVRRNVSTLRSRRT